MVYSTILHDIKKLQVKMCLFVYINMYLRYILIHRLLPNAGHITGAMGLDY